MIKKRGDAFATFGVFAKSVWNPQQFLSKKKLRKSKIEKMFVTSLRNHCQSIRFLQKNRGRERETETTITIQKNTLESSKNHLEQRRVCSVTFEDETREIRLFSDCE